MDIHHIATKADIEELKNEIRTLKESLTTQAVQQKKWLRSADVMALLKVSASGLQNLRVSGALPFTKFGATLYYDLSDIERILVENKQNNS